MHTSPEGILGNKIVYGKLSLPMLFFDVDHSNKVHTTSFLASIINKYICNVIKNSNDY